MSGFIGHLVYIVFQQLIYNACGIYYGSVIYRRYFWGFGSVTIPEFAKNNVKWILK